MKELIVIMGSLLLGCILFDMIAGDEGSLKTVAAYQMEQMLQWYRGR